MQSANLSGPFRGCLYYALLGLPQATGLAGGYDSWTLCSLQPSCLCCFCYYLISLITTEVYQKHRVWEYPK